MIDLHKKFVTFFDFLTHSLLLRKNGLGLAGETQQIYYNLHQILA